MRCVDAWVPEGRVLSLTTTTTPDSLIQLSYLPLGRVDKKYILGMPRQQRLEQELGQRKCWGAGRISHASMTKDKKSKAMIKPARLSRQASIASSRRARPGFGPMG